MAGGESAEGEVAATGARPKDPAALGAAPASEDSELSWGLESGDCARVGFSAIAGMSAVAGWACSSTRGAGGSGVAAAGPSTGGTLRGSDTVRCTWVSPRLGAVGSGWDGGREEPMVEVGGVAVASTVGWSPVVAVGVTAAVAGGSSSGAGDG